MKKTILFFSFTLVIGYTNAQDYIPIPTDSVVWSELYQHPIDDSIPFQITDHYFGFLGEDTVINDTVYQQLVQFSDTVFDRAHATYMGGMRQENQKVYYRGNYHWASMYAGNEAERLLYDFSLEEGDTLFFPPPGQSVMPYDVVSKVDSLFIGGQYRKTIEFEMFDIWKWIEGIGNTYGLLLVEARPTDGTDLALVCHFHRGELLFHNDNLTIGDGTCFPFYTPPEGIKDQSIEILAVRPMPVTSTSFIKTDGIRGVPQILHIYNMTGQLVQTQKLNGRSSVALHRSNFKAGMYSFLLITQNQQYYKGRFIVN